MKHTHDGLPLAIEEHPGSGAGTMALVHATGFCKEVMVPVVDELRARGEDTTILAWDQRAHGDSGGSDHPYDWWDLGRDALTALAGREGPIVGVGHSSGGAALVMAELLRPATFDRLVLVEPIVFPPPYGSGDDHPLHARARRRKPSFSNRAAAAANFSGRPPFADWDPRAFAAYLDGCMEGEADGWRLKCLPEDEAEFYRSAGLHRAWDRLGEVAPPVVIVAGEHSDSHPPAFVERLSARFPNARSEIVPGTSHMLPMEAPARLAEIIRAGAGQTRPATPSNSES